MGNIGKRLKEQRLALGLDIDDISSRTRLTPKHIKALEEGDISFFHDDLSYLRFFVKSYCEAVHIDFEEIKDELRESVDDYTTTLLSKEEIRHQQMEENVARSEKLTKVHGADVHVRQRRKLRRPDVSLVSFIAVIGVVVIIILLAFVIWMKSDSNDDDIMGELPMAPAESEQNDQPQAADPEPEPTEKKELEIVQGTDATRFDLLNVADGDTLTLETTFTSSGSAYSVTILTDGKEEVRDNKIYENGTTATTEIEAKPGTEFSVYIGCMLQTEIKINDKVVKLDSSVNPTTWAGYCQSNTFTFTVGENDEPAE